MSFDETLLSLAHDVINHARDKGVHIVTAESCTGGLIAGCLTEISGSSDVVEGGFITYSNQMKIALLGVSKQTLYRYGAVSSETAHEMVMGALKATPSANLAVAVTGVAGPSASENKSMGLVYIAWHSTDWPQPIIKKFNFKPPTQSHLTRQDIRHLTIQSSLEGLLDYLNSDG